MAININRPTITYENIALFQSDAPAHSAASNSGDGLSFLPLVQGINFSVDIPRTNAGALGTKGFVDQSNRNAPDVQFSINTIEDFGDLFSGLFSGDNIRDNLNLDRNFYAYIAPKRGIDARKDRSGNESANDVRYYCVRSLFSHNTDVAIPYPGTTLYEEDFDGSNRTVLGTYVEPTGVQVNVTSGKVYYGDKPTHWHGRGNNDSLIPFHLAGKQFGFYTNRYAPNRISVLSLEDNADVDVYVNVTNGINGTPTYSASLNAGETYVFEDSTAIATIIIDSNKNILCSKEGSAGDKLLLAPVETDAYTRKNNFEFNVLNSGPQTASNHHVYDPSGAFAIHIADGLGSDAVGHIGYNKLTKYQAFASSESSSIGGDTPNWTVVAPYPDTDVNISYYSGSSWQQWSGFNLYGTKTNPAVNYDFDPLIGVRLWKMESTKPVAFFINDEDNDEEILIGWNDEHLPENQTSLGQFLSFGNCFLNSISISQSINGLAQSRYSFTASNVQAQEANPHDVGFNDLLYTGMSVPSIDLTGSQTQNLTTDISGIEKYYSNGSDNIIPSYSTNVTIRGSGSVGNFLIKSDSIQSFDLNLPINRKTIYSLGKKYPVKRKALFPIAGSFNFSNLVSSFELSDTRSNLKEFLNSDEDYLIDIACESIGGDSFDFWIQKAKLISQSQESAIGSKTSANLGFNFELNNFKQTTLLERFQGASLAYSLRSLGTNQWEYVGDTVTYTSHFSAGVDGWTYWVNASAISTADPVDAGNALKVTVDTSLDLHRGSAQSLTTGKNYRISAQVYIPSSNAVLDGFGIMDSSGGMKTDYYNIAQDKWVDVSTSGIAVGTLLSLRGTSGTSYTFQGNGTDHFYVRNIVITETLGDTEVLPVGKYVTQVRRSSDDAVKSFTAAEVSDGTLEAWVNTDVDITSRLIVPSDIGARFVVTSSTDASNYTVSIDNFSASPDFIEIRSGLFGEGHYRLRGTLEASNLVGNIKIQTNGGVATGTQNVSITGGTNNLDFEFDITGDGSTTAAGQVKLYFVSESGASATIEVSDLTWEVTSANGHVSKWYDQSGNNNHAIQGTAANQPKIVEGGSLIERNGNPAVKSTSNNRLDFTLDSLSSDGQQSVFAVLENDVTSQDGYSGVFRVVSNSTGVGGANRRPWWFVAPDGRLVFSVDSLSGYLNTDREYRLYSHIMNDDAGGTSTINQDGTQVDTRSITLDANSTFLEGNIAGVSTNATGALYMSELIYYPSDQSANRIAIEKNIKKYYKKN